MFGSGVLFLKFLTNVASFGQLPAMSKVSVSSSVISDNVGYGGLSKHRVFLTPAPKLVATGPIRDGSHQLEAKGERGKVCEGETDSPSG